MTEIEKMVDGIPVVIQEDEEIIKKYDPEFRFRQMTGMVVKLVFVMTIVLSIFHIYTAGFGVLQEWRHRAFHLAFVLPLVYFFYSIRRQRFEGVKHLVYDILYALIGTSLIASMLKEILSLRPTWVVWGSIISFLLILYFKRREFWPDRWIAPLDGIIFTVMVIAMAWIWVTGYMRLDLAESFQSLNPTLLFWSVLLFLTFAAISLLFILQWIYALKAVFNRGFPYVHDNIPYFDVFFAFLSSAASVYVFLEFNQLVVRSGLPHQTDLLFGALATIMVLEGARRSVGPALPLIAYLVLINAYLGPYFLDIPGLSFFAHRGYSVSRIIEHMYLGTEGIFGIPLGVVATFVFHFVLFGIFISKSGLGNLFMDVAMALAGWSAGGPAKVAVISSGFMGSISGSSIANTVTTGAFTIPLMKKVGYPPQFAGAVEAAASTGGQLMPPVMGAAAFVMAEFLGIPYIKIATCAIIPSFLHFFAVGLMVHFMALKLGLVGLPREQLPKVWNVLRERWVLLLPLIVMVYLLISGTSPFLAAFWSIIYAVSIGQVHEKTYSHLTGMLLAVPCVLFWVNPFHLGLTVILAWLAAGALVAWLSYRASVARQDWLIGLFPSVVLIVLLAFGVEPFLSAFLGLTTTIVIGMFYRETKMSLKEMLNTLEAGTKNALAIGAACACVGFIVGATTLTGLGLKFASMVIDLSSGISQWITSVDLTHLLALNDVTLFFTLFFTAIACLVLGMGLPTTAQYIIASMIAAPALLKFGIHPLISHMFVLFYAVLADVTPPVALAAYAASGISGADPFKTGFTAFSLSSAKVYVPFAFTYSPIILWMPKILNPAIPFNFGEFLLVFLTIVFGVVALGATIVGYLGNRSTLFERICTGIAAACLLLHEPISSYVGIGILVAVYLVQHFRKRKTAELLPGV